VYNDRTAWRCAVFVGKRYGSKGYPQINAAHVWWTLPITSNSPLKQHLSGERFPDDGAIERAVCTWFRQQLQKFYAADIQGLVKRWDTCLNLYGDYAEKLNVVCMSLSPFVSFQSLFVTYLLTSLVICKNFPSSLRTARP
jgi:hypothetical protein